MISPIIKVKAMCLIWHNNQILVADGMTLRGTKNGQKIVPDNFFRVLGGSINFHEKSIDGLRREIREELHSELENIKLIEVIENRFIHQSKNGHEIIFLYQGELQNKDLYTQSSITVDEGEYQFDAIWLPLAEIWKADKPIYPQFNYRKWLDNAQT